MASSNFSDYTISNLEGTTSSKFVHALDYTTKKFISSIKFSLFKSQFPEIYRKYPTQLKTLHEQLRTELSSTISEEVNQLCKEQNIEFLLNNLDAIKKSQPPTQTSWRPSGNPEEDLRDHIYPIKLKEKEALEEMLSKLKMENEELEEQVASNHLEILSIHKENDELQKNVTSVIESLLELQQNLKNSIRSDENDQDDEDD